MTYSTHEATAAALAKFWWGGPRNAAPAYVDSWRDGVSAAAAVDVYGPLLWTKADGRAELRGRGDQPSGGQWGYTPFCNGLVPTASSSSAPLAAGSGLTALRTTGTR